MLGVQKTKQQLVRLYRVLFGATVEAAGDKMDAWLAQRTETQFDPSQNQSEDGSGGLDSEEFAAAVRAESGLTADDVSGAEICTRCLE